MVPEMRVRATLSPLALKLIAVVESCAARGAVPTLPMALDPAGVAVHLLAAPAPLTLLKAAPSPC